LAPRTCSEIREFSRRTLAQQTAGETRAFAAVYVNYRMHLFTFLFRLCGERQLAEDLFQNTWLKLARLAPRLRPGLPKQNS